MKFTLIVWLTIALYRPMSMVDAQTCPSCVPTDSDVPSESLHENLTHKTISITRALVWFDSVKLTVSSATFYKRTNPMLRLYGLKFKPGSPLKGLDLPHPEFLSVITTPELKGYQQVDLLAWPFNTTEATWDSGIEFEFNDSLQDYTNQSWATIEMWHERSERLDHQLTYLGGMTLSLERLQQLPQQFYLALVDNKGHQSGMALVNWKYNYAQL